MESSQVISNRILLTCQLFQHGDSQKCFDAKNLAAQASCKKNKSVDKRSDIWSFGAVLYEMLSGKKAFEGESVSDTLATVMKLDPDWSALPQEIYGLWLIEELEEHGYRVSPGTLYPLLHSLEKSGTLKSYNKVFAGKIRRYYIITPKGRRLLLKAKRQLAELVGEIFEGEDLQSYLRKRKSASPNGKPHAR